MSLAQLNSAEKSFHRKLVLHDLNVTIERSELIAVLGTNGAGKTTLLRLLAGLLGLFDELTTPFRSRRFSRSSL